MPQYMEGRRTARGQIWALAVNSKVTLPVYAVYAINGSYMWVNMMVYVPMLKNMDCKLMQEIKQLQADGRMVLTGTPLQVCRPCTT